MVVPATTDVLVFGSGAAGLTAAVTAAIHGARVIVLERDELLGGTSAWSGGHVWIPCNPHMGSVGASDTPEEAFTYIMSLGRGLIEERLARAYIEAGPEMVRFLDAHTPTSFYAVADFPDYHPEQPGGRPHGGRTIECPLFSYHELGAWAQRVRTTPYFPTPHISMSETPLGAAKAHPPSPAELARREAGDVRGLGQALVGRLLKACLDRGVELHVSTRARRLRVEGGRVVSADVDTPDGPQTVAARAGVILATGGFEWNENYKRAFLRGPLTHPVSVPTNTGDGLYMAMHAGAMLANMREAWWLPVAEVPTTVNPMGRVMVATDRSRPRSIMVNRRGQRFTNEAANYNALGGAFHVEDVSQFTYANLPAWMVVDHGYIRRYGLLGVHPAGDRPPDWVIAADTLDELAERLGMPAGALPATVDRWNEHVAAGHDPDFHRGMSAHDRWWGDAAFKGDVRANLGPLDEPPFYAIPIHSGALGTKGGPRVDPDARVLNLDGEPIAGLYAAGNVMGSPFGMTYGGAGGTLGPAMVFGWLAGRHAAGALPTP